MTFCVDRHRQYHCCGVHQQTRWDPFPPPAEASSGPVTVASDSGHNSESQTHSQLPQCDSRPPVSAEPAHHVRVESPPRSGESDIPTVGNSNSGHVCNSSQHASSPVHVSSSGASGTGNRCLVTGLAGEVDVHVSTVSPAKQSHLEAQDHPDLRRDTNRPLVDVTTVVSTPATTECGPPTILSVLQRLVVITGLHLERQVVPSARMEALMQHYQAAGFSKEVSKLAAAPRRPSTNRMYDDRWLPFTNWATGRGFDPLGPTAAQIAAFLYELFELMACRLRLSKDTGPISPQSLAAQARRQQSRLRLVHVYGIAEA